MSLTNWCEWDRELLDSLFPEKPKPNVSGILKAPPLTKHYSTIGTAFDYALRFLISQDHKLPQLNHWVAYNSLKINNGQKRRNFLKTVEKKVFDYTFNNTISIFDLLPDCITLAKLDSIFRSGMDFPNSDIFSIDQKDIEDLTNLIKLVDINLFKAKRECLLNPTFGQTSHDIGGADADLILDDKLIDIKTIKNLEFDRETFRQLIGYYLLNLREDEILGEINHLGIYYSRFGLIFTFPTPIAQLENYYSDISRNERENMPPKEFRWWLNLAVDNDIHEYQECIFTKPQRAECNTKSYRWELIEEV